MKRVLVIGCPGGGKSTFARKLAEKTKLPLHYLDMLWHKSDKTNIAPEEFDKRLKEIIGGDSWIIDGNYLRTLEMRLRNCDTVFLLDFPVELCLSGAHERIGKSREDMPWIETELDEEFRQWITDFPQMQLPQIYTLIEGYKNGRQITVFTSRQQADAYLQDMP